MKMTVPSVDTQLRESLQHKINQKTKPLGSLGQLETIACQIGCIQQTLTPSLHNPHLLVFAADHGIAQESVSAYPQSVTAQMVTNFLNGGAAINVFTRQHNLAFQLIDAGVNHELSPHPNLIHAKVAFGTKNFSKAPAMSSEQCDEAIRRGADIMQTCINKGCNIVGFGEMGIGNTTSASALMAALTGQPVAQCVGRGTGLNNHGIEHKISVIKKALNDHHLSTTSNPLSVLATVGGFEIAMIVGAMFKAAQEGCVIVVDGFIVTSALLVAQAIDRNILDYCVFAHQSDEAPHQSMLQYLNATPILSMGLRLGEGTGAALAFPLIASAVLFFNEMATFESANVSNNITCPN